MNDTGLGLTAEDLQRIFLPFERLRSAQSDIEGAGIGLTVSAGLAKAMSGEITVESEPGLGSTFTLCLPRAADLTAETVAAQSAITTGPPVAEKMSDELSSLRVLYIEDNSTNVHLIQNFFDRRSGAKMFVAQSGLVGLRLAQGLHPHVILLDRHLPDLMGEEVFERLRANPETATIPVIVISADASPDAVKHFLVLGVRAYLTKPVSFVELDELLGEIATAQAPDAGR